MGEGGPAAIISGRWSTISRTFRTLCSNTREAVNSDGRTWALDYELCSERTRSGREFLYIKAYERCFHDHELLYEDLGLSQVLAADANRAIDIYARVCQAGEPLSAIHLADVTRDLLLEPDVRAEELQRPYVARRRFWA